MTLDELASQFRRMWIDPNVRQLGQLLHEWKTTEATVADLSATVERYFGTVEIKSETERERAFVAWSRFREEVIDRIGGMTMNERLYRLGLFERFDSDESARSIIYQKLLACP
ncbi:MAG: hypothetical protein AAF809_07795 [Bacteroidota bacterium]